jgi:hypothetical protein
MSAAFLLIFGACAWFRPTAGFGLFILLMTPLRNVLVPILHAYTWVFLLMPAILRLLLRRGRPLRAIEICALVFSLILFIREAAILPPGFPLTKLIFLPLLAITWGPQMLAFNALNEKEVSNLRLWMSAAAIVIGVWGALIYVTNNSYLISLARPKTFITFDNLSASTEKLVSSRFIIIGVFGVVPYAYWYVLRGALASFKQQLVWNLIMWGGIAAILITVGLSLTRSLLILLVAGTVVMVVTGTVALSVVQLLNKKSSRKNKTRIFLSIAIGICVFGAGVHYIDLSAIINPFEKRLSVLSQDDQNVSHRLDQSSIAWKYIKDNNGCILGAPDPQSIVGVDTAIFLRVWLLYGVLGVIAFAAMYIGAFGSLFNCWLSSRLSPEDILLRSMLTAWALAYVYAIFAGYSLHMEEVFFTMLFFSEVSRLNNKRLKSIIPQVTRFAR